MNKETMEIRELMKGEKPKKDEVPLTAQEAAALASMPYDKRRSWFNRNSRALIARGRAARRCARPVGL